MRTSTIILLAFVAAAVALPLIARKKGRAPGALIERIWLIVFEPVRAINDFLARVRRHLDSWWETASSHTLPHGWGYARLVLGCIGTSVWLVMFLADLWLFGTIVRSTDLAGTAASLLTVGVVSGTSVAGLFLTDSLGYGRVIPRPVGSRRHLAGAVAAGAVLAALLGFQAYLGGVRAASVRDDRLAQVHQLDAKAAALRQEGFSAQADAAVRQARDLTARSADLQTGREALSRGGPVVLGALEALTSGAPFALLFLIGTGFVGGLRLSVAVAQRAAAVPAELINHLYILHRHAFEPNWKPQAQVASAPTGVAGEQPVIIPLTRAGGPDLAASPPQAIEPVASAEPSHTDPSSADEARWSGFTL